MDEHTDEPNPSTPGAGDTALRELALRLLQWSSSNELWDVQLLPGALPPNLPFAVPIPPGARVVGTLTCEREIRVVLETDLPSEQVIAFYREHLRAAGWAAPEAQPPRTRQPSRRMSGGFMPTPLLRRQRFTLPAFSTEAWALALSIEMARGGESVSEGTSSSGEGPTDVQLAFHAGAAYWYKQPRAPQRVEPDEPDHLFHPGQLVPTLVAPEGAQQHGLGGGGSIEEFRWSARLTTDLDLAAIEEHYAQQLEGAGWTRRGGVERCSVMVWSAWAFVDEDKSEPWQGMLVVLRWPEATGGAAQGLGVPKAYLVEARVMWAGGDPHASPYY